MEERKSVLVTFWYAAQERKVELVVGRTYRVEPLNSRKLKNRGRECLLLDFVPVSKQDPSMVAKVRFLDNNRIGKIEYSDLVPIE